MIELLDLHKAFILKHLKKGDTAVDFTMGNGHDTAFLSETVGQSGCIYAFDIQEVALKNTYAILEAKGCPHNYTLILDSHHKVREYVNMPIKAGMFNLGYLPGGNKSITTMRQTTLPALTAAISLLDRNAVLTIAIYPGHAEGDAEGRLIEQYLMTLDRHIYCATQVRIVNSPAAPFFFMVETK